MAVGRWLIHMQPGVQTIRPAVAGGGPWGAPRIGCDPRFPGFEGTFYTRNYRTSPGRGAAGYPLRDEPANPVTLVAGRGIEPRHAGHEPARLPLSYPSDDFIMSGETGAS